VLINRDTSAERSLAELHKPPAGSNTMSEGTTKALLRVEAYKYKYMYERILPQPNSSKHWSGVQTVLGSKYGTAERLG